MHRVKGVAVGCGAIGCRTGSLVVRCMKLKAVPRFYSEACVRHMWRLLVQNRAAPRVPQRGVCVPTRVQDALHAAHIPCSRPD